MEHSIAVLAQRFSRFMNGTQRLLWINSPLAKIYVRKSTRLVAGKLSACLDLSSIEVVESHRRRGIMGSVVEFMLDFKYPVFIENIMDDGVRAAFEKRGFEPVDGSPMCLIGKS